MRRLFWLLVLVPVLAVCGEDKGDGNNGGSGGSGGSGGTNGTDIPGEPDVTAPVVTLDLERFALLRDGVEIPVAVEEEHLAGVRLVAGDEVLASGPACQPTDSECAYDGHLLLDTPAVADGLYWVSALAIDKAGNETRTAEVPVIVANRGERVEIEYDPGAVVKIPAIYDGQEIDVRAQATSKPNIRRVITWVNWDPAANWRLEYSLGQGLCPHRGILYVAEESLDGEIVLDLDRADVAPAIVANYPAADRDSDTFPTNDDELTYGLFFGHVAPMDPSEHLGASLPIEAGMVFLYAE